VGTGFSKENANAEKAMPLHIRDRRALELARKLAARRGQTMTQAVIGALQNELRRDSERRPLAERLEAIAAELVARGDPAAARSPAKAEIDALWGNG
jgi:antitoxin VapB